MNVICPACEAPNDIFWQPCGTLLAAPFDTGSFDCCACGIELKLKLSITAEIVPYGDPG